VKSESVFVKYAHEYDLITDAVKREKPHAREVEALVQYGHPEAVLDAGCATGLTSYLFAQRGARATGLDRSRRMVALAREKYASTKLPLDFRYGHFERLPQALNERFDMVVCLANSISGVETKRALKSSLLGFYRVLRPGGSLVIQALNYEAVPSDQVFPIRATQHDRIGYIRYARRRGRRLEITLVRLDLSVQPPAFETFVHEFDNYSPVELSQAIKVAGFTGLRRYGNLTLSKPFRKRSRDVVLVSRKP
jgi:ubiquinone/menaquinone biosynthesis C-methylase UbiE